jgi:flagellar biosynthesis protein FliP
MRAFPNLSFRGFSWRRSSRRRSFWRRACGLIVLLLVVGGPLWARSPAAPGFSLPGLLPGASAPGSSASWNIVVLLTLLTMIPAIVLSMTPFVRLIIVFHFLRQALGTQTAPSNQTLIGLSLILTFFLMQPVGAAIYTDAIVPLDEGHITMMTALDRSIVPMRHFMLKFAREKDLALFVELAHDPRPARPEDLGMRIVAPAYLLSELQAGFRIGAALFLPFLVIDLVTAAVTTSIGMMQLPPVIISTPLKILLFVVVDGWNLLVGSLMRSFS